jgi:hypothetical protein
MWIISFLEAGKAAQKIEEIFRGCVPATTHARRGERHMENKMHTETYITTHSVDNTDGTTTVFMRIYRIHNDTLQVLERGDWREASDTERELYDRRVHTHPLGYL